MFVIEIFCKHDWAFPLKDKKAITNSDIFPKILNKYRCKTWFKKPFDKGSKFHKNCLQNNNIEIDSTHNEGKSIVAERFIRNLKNNIKKHVISISKVMCFYKLGDIVKKKKKQYITWNY